MTQFRFPQIGSSQSEHLSALRRAISSAWHGVWTAASNSPWVAIALMVPAVALLVVCTRVSVRRG